METSQAIQFKALSHGGPELLKIESMQIEILDHEGIRVIVEIPAAAWDSIKRIARAGGEDPRDRVGRLVMSACARVKRDRLSSRIV